MEGLVVNRRGFSLVELLTVMAVLGILAVSLLVGLNPAKQLSKAKDARRLTQLNEIYMKMADYYDDNNCYPSTIPFGGKWEERGVTYMDKAPQDPNYPKNAGYVYIAPNTVCPQWGVTFVKLVGPQTKSSCDLSSLCLPNNYTNQWACKLFGSPSCAQIAGFSLPSGGTVASLPVPQVPVVALIGEDKEEGLRTQLTRDEAVFIEKEPGFEGPYLVDVSVNSSFIGGVNWSEFRGDLKEWRIKQRGQTILGWGVGKREQEGVKGSFIRPLTARGDVIPLTQLWERYQCGTPIYWRLRSGENLGQVRIAIVDCTREIKEDNGN